MVWSPARNDRRLTFAARAIGHDPVQYAARNAIPGADQREERIEVDHAVFGKLVCECHQNLEARGVEAIPQSGIDAATQADKQKLRVIKGAESSTDEKHQFDTEVQGDRNVNHWRMRLEIARANGVTGIVLRWTRSGLQQSRRLKKPRRAGSKRKASRFSSPRRNINGDLRRAPVTGNCHRSVHCVLAYHRRRAR